MSATGKFKNWLHDRKDSSVSLVLEKFLQKKIERYGRLIELKIDSRQRTASVRLILKGEHESVTVLIERYELSDQSGQMSVILRQASSSREWLTLLLQDFVLNKPVVVPEQYAAYVKLAL